MAVYDDFVIEINPTPTGYTVRTDAPSIHTASH